LAAVLIRALWRRGRRTAPRLSKHASDTGCRRRNDATLRRIGGGGGNQAGKRRERVAPGAALQAVSPFPQKTNRPLEKQGEYRKRKKNMAHVQNAGTRFKEADRGRF
jgi:hypothetical protein